MPHDLEFDGLLERLADVGEYGSLDEFFRNEDMTSTELLCLCSDRKRNQFRMHASRLSSERQLALVKALTRVEVGLGGLGSVSCVAKLVDADSKEGRQMLDWVLRHYPNYYYGMGARSIAEYDESIRLRAARRERARKLEQERQAAAQSRKADEATQKLFNAVRRGDLKAVEALLVQRADPNQPTPCGQSLDSYARQEGKQEIAELLEKYIR